METIFLNTPIGIVTVSGNPSGITALNFDTTNQIPTTKNKIPPSLKEASAQLTEYFHGKRTDFNLNLVLKGTPFQQKVWKALCQIPYGKTMSYLELARKIGDPKAVRAVATANAKNKLAIVVPCHRVIGSDGNLTGYAWGLSRKKWLIEKESGATQTTLF